MSKIITILGCGWLGSALKNTLEARHKVFCASKDIKENQKIQMYHCDILVIALPPKNNAIEVINKTLHLLQSKPQIILLSSLSFYTHKRSIVEIEKLVQSLHPNTTVIRLGGLMGYNRIAGKYTAGKSIPSNSPTHYIHQDDAVGIIEKVIEEEITDTILNAIAPKQSTKKDIYTQNAKQFNFEKTYFTSETLEHHISYALLPKKFDYTFLKEDVHTFWVLP